MPKDMHGVMSEFKNGELHSGSKNGPLVTSRAQAVAVGLSEQRQQGKDVPAKKKKRSKPGNHLKALMADKDRDGDMPGDSDKDGK